MQEGYVFPYDSRQLKPNKVNYPTHDLQLADIVYAMKIRRHYLYEASFVTCTDHKSLKYLLTPKDLNLKQKRSLEFIKDYDLPLHITQVRQMS